MRDDVKDQNSRDRGDVKASDARSGLAKDPQIRLSDEEDWAEDREFIGDLREPGQSDSMGTRQRFEGDQRGEIGD